MARKRITSIALYCCYCTLAAYLLTETLYSTLYATGIIRSAAPTSFYIIEDKGGLATFDPICGYRLASTPARHARITEGVVEYSTLLRGNSEGFPDRDDFTPERKDPRRVRIAVLGDSFTACTYLREGWTDKVEDLTRDKDAPLELLNFSQDGIGIANWWSILTRLIAAKDYQIDAVLYAVFDCDFDRGFYYADYRATDAPRCSMGFWVPEQWPQTREEALPLLGPLNEAYIVPPATFDRALAGRWHPGDSRPWRPYVALRLKEWALQALHYLLSLFGGRVAHAAVPGANEEFQQGAPALIEQMAAFSKSRSIPAIVVRIPSREALINGWNIPPKTLTEFAYRLSATFVDGSEAFAGLSPDAIRADWLPYDGHWGQGGSDRFASFMADFLQAWARGPMREKRFDPAGGAAQWRDVVKRYPALAYPYRYLAAALREAGDVTASIEAYRNAVERDAGDVDAVLQVAAALEGSGQYDEAVHVYEEALTNPAACDVLCAKLDEVLIKRNDPAARVARWRAIVTRYPTCAAARRFLSSALQGSGDLAGALADYQARLSANAKDEEALLGIGTIYEETERVDEAIQAYRQAILAAPRDYGPYEKLNALYVRGHDVDQQMALWRSVIAECPQSSHGYYHLGALLEVKQDFDAATDALRRAVAIDPCTPATQACLGKVLMHTGDCRGAVDAFRMASKVAPDWAEVRPLLVQALVESKQDDTARQEAAECRARNIPLPQELLDKLGQESVPADQKDGPR